ncbi:MAG: hypothetical protein COB99_05385 [Sulfurimonas sp.]|nr:MAG: hypothetical protein COB99_05385 [Sulfurimonas sp.]
MKSIISIIVIFLLSGCGAYDTLKLGHIDKNQKTITVPAMGISMFEIKKMLIKNNWKLKASADGNIASGTNIKQIDIHTKTYYKSRYRMNVMETNRMEQFVLTIFISVIDNETQEEVLSISGDSMGAGGVFPSSTAKELQKALKEIEL